MESRVLLTGTDPIITEFMASNKDGITDSYGENSDWIEIHNPSPLPVSMDGWYLTSSDTDPTKWRFPDITIGGGGYLVVFASGRDRRNPAAELHTDFDLSAGGGYLALVKPDGATPSNQYYYPKQVANISYGLMGEGGGGTLVGAGAAATVTVPASDIGSAWTGTSYSDGGWIHGTTGVGYDATTTTEVTTGFYYGQYGTGGTWNLYEVVSSAATFMNAHNAAAAKSQQGVAGHLVSIHSAAENTFVQGIIGGDCWVGLTDDDANFGTLGAVECGNTSSRSLPADGSVPIINPTSSRQRGAGFVWTTGEAFTWQKWTSGQPNGNGDYVRLSKSDGSWNDQGTTNTYTYVIEYDLHLASEPQGGEIPMPRRFTVHEAHVPSGQTIASISDALNFLAEGTGTLYDYEVSSINLIDPGQTDGHYSNSVAFKGNTSGTDEYFALRITAMLKIPTTGQYTLGINSDDGFRLSIDGANFTSVYGTSGTTISGGTMEFAGGRSPGDSLGVTTLTAGEHRVELTYYQGAGGSEIEFYAASGAKTAWDSGFALVGGPAGLQLASFSDHIATDIQGAMYKHNSSAYIRIPFTASTTDLGMVTLKMKYDDAFVAYINGVEVARSDLAPENVYWNSAATENAPDADGLVAEVFDISAAKQFLSTTGTNVLAIHLLSSGMNDSDALAVPEITWSTVGYSDQQRYFVVPTPRDDNNAGTNDLGPIITDLTRSIPLPVDSDTVVITAEVSAALSPVSSVVLRYRVNYGTETESPMYDDGLHGDGAAGDHVYGATISSSVGSAGQMVRYYVVATDTQARSSRWPIIPVSDPDPRRKWPEYEGYMVADASVVSSMPVFYWFVADPNAAANRTGTRASVWFNGEFYDNIFCRARGGSATGGTKFDFNKGYGFRWDPDEARVSEIDLNKKGGLAPDDAWIRPILTYETFRDAGSAASACQIWRVQQSNGAAVTPLFRIFIEVPKDEYLERNGLYGGGAFYKTPNSDNPTITSATYFEKKNRDAEGYADLQALLNGIHLSDLAARQRFILDNFDIPSFLDYQAATVITEDLDCVQKNYFLYRDTRDEDNPNGTNLWRFLPWDKHLTFGKSYGISDYLASDPQAHPFFGDSEHPKIDGSGAWNWLIDTLLDTPEVKAMYQRRLRTVMDQFLQTDGTPYADRYMETRLDQLYALLMGDAVFVQQNGDLKWAFDDIKNKYLPRKRTHFYVDHTNPAYSGSANINAAQPANPVINFGTVEYNPASGNQDQEYIELRNHNSYAVDVSGWRLSGGIEYTLEPGTVILAGGSLYISPDPYAFRQRSTGPGGNQRLNVVGPYDDHLSARGETLTLSDGAGNVVGTYTYGDTQSVNQQYLRITEVMYNPPDPSGSGQPDNDEFEFVELKNISTTQTLDLAGVTFTDGIDFTFPNLTLAPGQYVLVVKNRTAFESRYGAGLSIAGEYPYKYLDNTSDRIRLADANGEEVLDFDYDETWYRATDKLGRSLVIIDPLASPETWKSSASWRPSTVVNGTPAAGDTDPSLGAPWVHINNVLPEKRYTPVTDPITIRFSEPVQGFSITDLALTRDGAALTLTADMLSTADGGQTWLLSGLSSLTGTAGKYVLTLAGGTASGITDLAGNALVGGDDDTFYVQTVPLTVDIADVVPDHRTSSFGPVTITFNRSVDHFGLRDLKFARSGGANLLSGLERVVKVNDLTYRVFGLTAIDNAEGTYVLSLDPATTNITDEAGFPLSTGDSEQVVVDRSAPSVTITPVSPDPHNGPVSEITITFSEPIVAANFTIADLTLKLNGGPSLLTNQPLESADGGKTWTLKSLSAITATAGNYVLTLNASGSGIADLTGNLLLAGASESWTGQLAAVTATISTVTPDPRNTAVSAVVFTFSEAVTGFDRNDLQLTRDGVVLALPEQPVSSDGGITWMLAGLSAITAASGTYVLTLTASGSDIVGGSGNPLGNSPSESWTTDAAAPTVSITPVSPDPRKTAVSDPITITFSEVIAGFSIDDLQLTRDGGANLLSAQPLSSSDGGKTWTLSGLSSLTGTSGTYVLSFKASHGITDSLGNALASTPTESWLLDLAAPTVTITGPASDPTKTAVSQAIFSFSEAVSGFDRDDLILFRDRRVVAFTAAQSLVQDDPAHYRLIGLADLTAADGEYELWFDVGTGIADMAGNLMADLAPLTWTMDGTAPGVSITAVNPDPRNAAIAAIEFTFSEAVTGFDVADVQLTRDGVDVPLSTPPGSSDDGYTWSLSGLSGLTAQAGVYVIALRSSATISDAAGNNVANRPTETWTTDTTAPTVAIAAVGPDPRNSAVSAVQFTFSEAVGGFDLADVQLTRDGVDVPLSEQPTSEDGGITWVLNGLSGLTSQQGTYVISLRNDATITDLAGNNLANHPSETWTMDATAPTATIVAVSPDPRNSAVDSIQVVFSEPVSGFGRTDLQFSRDEQALVLTDEPTSEDGGLTWTLGGLSAITGASGTYVLTLMGAATGIADAAGNPLANSPSESWMVDAIAPTVTLATVTPDPHLPGVEPIVLSFSEPVAHFEKADLRLTRDGVEVDLGSAQLDPSADQKTWTLGNLQDLTRRLGLYELSIRDGSGIADPAGNPLANSPVESFVVNAIVGDQNASDLNDSIRLAAHPGDPTLIDVYVNGDAPYTVKLANLPSIQVDGGAGVDTLTIESASLPAVQFKATGPATLNINAGSWTFDADLSVDAPNLKLNVDSASVTFNATQHLAGLNLVNGATATLSAGGRLLSLGDIQFDGTSTLDINDGFVIVRPGADSPAEALADINGWIGTARNATLPWTGVGLTSGTARTDRNKLTGIGVMLNEQNGNAIHAKFADEDVTKDCILVRYTWNGDADLNGAVNTLDYAKIDAGFLSQGSAGFVAAWSNGNFDFNSQINTLDYALIDSAFLGQSGAPHPAASQVAAPRAASKATTSRIVAKLQTRKLIRTKKARKNSRVL